MLLKNTKLRLIICSVIFTILFYFLFLYIDLGQIIYNVTRENNGDLSIVKVFLNCWFFVFPLIILLILMIVDIIRYFIKFRGLIGKLIVILIILLELLYTFVVSLYYMSPAFCFYPTKGDIEIYNNPKIEEIDFNSNKALYYDNNKDNITIFFPGNGQAASSIYSYLLPRYDLSLMNTNLLVIDYPMFGNNLNRLDMKNVLKEADSIIDYVINQMNYNINNVRIYGFSIGTGIASYTASRYDVSELVLVAPYDEFRNVMNSYTNVFIGPLEFCSRFNFKSKEYLEGTNIKTTIIYTINDKVINYNLSLNLASSIKNKEIIEVDAISHGGAFYNDISINKLFNIEG